MTICGEIESSAISAILRAEHGGGFEQLLHRIRRVVGLGGRPRIAVDRARDRRYEIGIFHPHVICIRQRVRGEQRGVEVRASTSFIRRRPSRRGT